MKRILIITMLFGLTFSAKAQGEISSDSQYDTLIAMVGDDDTTQSKMMLQLGIQGGAMLLFMDDASPFTSKYGFLIELPLVFSYQATPHWKLSTGLTYRFQWTPLYYAVTSNSGNIEIDETAQVGKQHGYIYRSYVGVPLKTTWFPNAKNHGIFSLSFDCYAAYNVSEFINLGRVSSNVSTWAVFSTAEDGHSLTPWKLELGLTLGTDVLGMIHGVRFFGNLLPDYKDNSGNKIHTFGLTFYL